MQVHQPAPARTEQAAPTESTAQPEAEKPAREGFPGTLDKFLENDFDETDTDDLDDDTVGGELGDDGTQAVGEVDSEELMAEVERFLRDQGTS